VDPSIVGTPEYLTALAVASQPQLKPVVGENGEVTYVQTPGALPSWVVMPKPNATGVAPTSPFANAVAQRQSSAPTPFSNALTQTGPSVNNLGASALSPALTPPVAAPTAVAPTAVAPVAPPRPKENIVAYTTTDNYGNIHHFNQYGDEIIVTKNSGKTSTEVEKQRVAQEQLKLTIPELAKALEPGGLLDQSTSSAAGNIRDVIAGSVGYTTEGAAANAALAPIYDMVLKSVPRFEGPQSDADTRSYKEAAGRLSDPNATIGAKRAAGKTILRLMNARSDQFDISPSTITPKTTTPTAKTETAPNTNSKGWVLHTDAKGNKAYVSPDGKQFEEVK
jgi:hypothetical protein